MLALWRRTALAAPVASGILTILTSAAFGWGFLLSPQLGVDIRLIKSDTVIS